MAAPRDGNRLIVSFMPSLLHCASVQTAIPLLQDFGIRLTEEAFAEIEKEKLTTPGGGGVCLHFNARPRFRLAKECVLFIPAHLRQGVLDAVLGLDAVADSWEDYYRRTFDLYYTKDNFVFRSDGRMDAVKSAQNLVHNAAYDIEKRFEVACVFAMVESVEALWEEMVLFGVAGNFSSRGDIVSLWAGWLNSRRPREPSAQFIESLGTFISSNPGILDTQRPLIPRFSAMFPLWRPEDREKCLDLLDRSSLDDLRSCLYIVTEEEEEQILRNGVFSLLCTCLWWPQQTLFLERAGKLLDYMDEDCLKLLVNKFLAAMDRRKDINYAALFQNFLQEIPNRFRAYCEESPFLKRSIALIFEKSKKRNQKYQY